MKNRYRCEMDQLMPREKKMEELYAMMEGETDMKQAKWIGRRAVAVALVCFLLVATATAAAVPAIWQALTDNLGAFAPYAQNIRGASCQDQGIKVQILSALADDLEGRFFLSVQDVEGDRLSKYLTLEGRLQPSVEVPQSDKSVSVFSLNSKFDLVSYDPESKTALFSINTLFFEDVRPSGDAHLSLTGMTNQEGYVDAEMSCAAVTGEVLKSLPLGAGDETIFGPREIEQFDLTEAILPANRVVLAPEQDPMPLEGTEDMWISSMGFAEDGCFHIRLGFADGVMPKRGEEGLSMFYNDLYDGEPWYGGADGIWKFVCYETLVPGGMDILFPLIHVDDLEALKGCQANFYGQYTRPGIDIKGAWDIDFQVEYFSSAVLDWTGELADRQVTRVTLSPLSVTMNSSDWGGFSTTTLYAVKQDGSTVAAKPGTGSYNNIAYKTGASEPVWDAYNTWKFEEPVDLEEIVGLSLVGETIPVN